MPLSENWKNIKAEDGIEDKNIKKKTTGAK